MNQDCDACKFLAKPSHPILLTQHWSVELGNDQVYLGRAYVSLRTHKGSLSELSAEEWEDFQAVVRKLENAYHKAFGAEPLNWACLMNNAFRNDPGNPHVHWHVWPRYRKAVTLAGITFDDAVYGEHYDITAVRNVSDEVVDEIATQLKPYLED
jgi:diadenosine tetraphosphate (Ap4A) HIT family hydrolase